jgi:ABC-type uncharacterized transport system fused permease/ATPase subunit
MPSLPGPSPSASARVTLDRVAARTPDGHTLFSELSLAFGRERAGVVGRSDVGKTTLPRLIAGPLPPGLCWAWPQGWPSLPGSWRARARR